MAVVASRTSTMIVNVFQTGAGAQYYNGMN
jgi:hypothetical protein